MFKKAIPIVLMSGLVLGACNNNGVVPKNNETPMQDVQDRTRDWMPRNNNNAGPDFDGLDNGRNGNRNGVINDNLNPGINNANPNAPGNGAIINDNLNTPNGTINNGVPNRNNTNGNNR